MKKLEAKKDGSFQLDKVQDGFGDGRPPARRGNTSLRLGLRPVGHNAYAPVGEKFQTFLDGRIVSLASPVVEELS